MNSTEELNIAPDAKSFTSFETFYAFYLKEHSNTTCRRLHFLGSTLSLICLAMLAITGKPQYFLYGLLCGYGCAWVGHFVFEKNKPGYAIQAGDLLYVQIVTENQEINQLSKLGLEQV